MWSAPDGWAGLKGQASLFVESARRQCGARRVSGAVPVETDCNLNPGAACLHCTENVTARVHGYFTLW